MKGVLRADETRGEGPTTGHPPTPAGTKGCWGSAWASLRTRVTSPFPLHPATGPLSPSTLRRGLCVDQPCHAQSHPPRPDLYGAPKGPVLRGTSKEELEKGRRYTLGTQRSFAPMPRTEGRSGPGRRGHPLTQRGRPEGPTVSLRPGLGAYREVAAPEIGSSSVPRAQALGTFESL